MKWILAFIAATKCRYPLVWLWSAVFDTVYPIPAGSSPVSGSSGRESYQAKIYRLHSALTCQDNVTTVLRTEKIPSILYTVTTENKNHLVYRRLVVHVNQTKFGCGSRVDFQLTTLDFKLCIYRLPGRYTQTLAFATTTVAIYYYKKQILRSLNPRLLFMYWRRSVTALLVAKASAAALSKVSISNGHCISQL